MNNPTDFDELTSLKSVGYLYVLRFPARFKQTQFAPIHLNAVRMLLKGIRDVP